MRRTGALLVLVLTATVVGPVAAPARSSTGGTAAPAETYVQTTADGDSLKLSRSGEERFSWSVVLGGDPATLQFDVQIRRAPMRTTPGPAWTTLATATTQKARRFRIAPGTILCVRARAIADPATGWSTELCVVRQLDDSSARRSGSTRRVEARRIDSADGQATRLRYHGRLLLGGVPRNAYYGPVFKWQDDHDPPFMGLAGSGVNAGWCGPLSDPQLFGRIAPRRGTMVVAAGSGTWSDPVDGLVVVPRWARPEPPC